MEELRKILNEIDNQVVELYVKRLETVAKIGQFKESKHLPITNREREEEILSRLASSAPTDYAVYIKMLYQTIFETSKAYQTKFTSIDTPLTVKIKETLLEGSKAFPKVSSVACQGVEGSYSSIAAKRIFDCAGITFFKTFEGVCSAVENGLCRYGLLPIDNSLNGSVGEVYDLITKRNFYIVRSIKLPIRHSLLAKAGVKLNDIKEVYSHSQALAQCSKFIEKNELKPVEVLNTAVAAQMINRNDVAAIASAECASLYGLKIIESNIQNDETNFTRFICISKDLELFNDANRISIQIGLPHKSGSLNKVLSRFAAMNLNLTKLMSRPTTGTDFEYVFYLDFEANAFNGDAISLMSELENECESFVFLGSYLELN